MINLLFRSNIDKKKHTIMLKNYLKMQEDEPKNWQMMTWKTSWKNDISFAPTPFPSKMSLWFIHSKFDFFWHPPPFCTMSVILQFYVVRCTSVLMFKAKLIKTHCIWSWPNKLNNLTQQKQKKTYFVCLHNISVFLITHKLR